MDYFIELAAWSILAFFLLLLVLHVVSREVGYALGVARAQRKDEMDDGVSLVVSSVLTLTVFVMALTLSLSVSRNDERRSGAVNEANAIGTAWLQAKAIDHPRAAAIAELLKQYGRQRVDFVEADFGSARIEAANQATSRLQLEIWGHMSLLVSDMPGPQTSSMMNSLNGAFDATTNMRFAMGYRMAPQLAWLLLLLNLVAMGMLGYQFGLYGKRHPVLATVMSIAWTSVLVGILDIGSPRLGMFRTDVAAYEWNQQGFTDIPPAVIPSK